MGYPILRKNIWRFPKVGVPPVIIHFNGIFHHKPSRKPPYPSGLVSCQVNNPVILLDEIDKLTRNAMFNPSGAMLELLDPEQNHTFKDRCLAC